MKNIKLLLGSLGLGILLASCSETKQKEVETQRQFANVLNIKNTPKAAKDWDAFGFADLGAWHAYALPSDTLKYQLGGFSGPFIHTQGRWISENICQHKIAGLDKDFQQIQNIELNYFPGYLEQSFIQNEIKRTYQLYFVSSQSVLVKMDLENLSKKNILVRNSWSGVILHNDFEAQEKTDRIYFQSKTTPEAVEIFLPEGDVSIKHDGFIQDAKELIDLIAKKKTTLYWVQSTYRDTARIAQERKIVKHVLATPETYIANNKERWNAYLQKVVLTNSKWSQNKEYQRAAVKCLLTLIGNWKAPHGDLLHEGLFPSQSVWYFNGFWAWDSWKHAVALSLFEPEVAKNQMRTMFDYQDEMGMVADCIYANKADNNWRDTKPPLAVWAVYEIYRNTGDKAFVSEMLPKLMKYHKWWYEYRDHNKNQLCEYGSTDGTRIAAAWESGMDNAVRFDEAVMLKNNDKAWSINQESVDLNAYLYAEKNFLKQLHEALELEFKDETPIKAEDLKSLVQDKMFNSERGFFQDIRLNTEKYLDVMGPESWIPLWANLADSSQAKEVKNIMMDSSKFNTYVPLLTIQADHPKLDPYDGYWRGPVWLDQVYYGIEGLKNYGFHKEADQLTEKLFNNLEGFVGDDKPIHENYHPLNGKRLNAPNFSWSAAHLLLLYNEK